MANIAGYESETNINQCEDGRFICMCNAYFVTLHSLRSRLQNWCIDSMGSIFTEKLDLILRKNCTYLTTCRFDFNFVNLTKISKN